VRGAPLAALLIIAGLAGSEAHTGRTFYDDVTLAQVVEGADAIVVATPADPPRRTATFPVKGKPEEPFSYAVQRYVVVEIAHEAGTSKSQKPALTGGATIEVYGANLQGQLHVHELYVAQGVSKSPIYSRYEPTPATDDAADADARRVLLIRRGQDLHGKPAWKFVVDGAVERMATLPLVLKLRQRETPNLASPADE